MSTMAGGRKFYDGFEYTKHHEQIPGTRNEKMDDNFMLELIRKNVIGKDTQFQGAFGTRKALYCDYTASGRSLKFIEDYINENVLTHFGNTHTTTSVTSLQTTMFRQEARDIIRKSVNASENDAVIFTGTGCTGAVHKLIHALNLQAQLIVFVSPYEHHSNLLPWKEIGSKIVWVNEKEDGSFDHNNLEEHLKIYSSTNRPLIGCFAAASNVTGALVDVDRISHLMHKYNGFVFFDYATAGPYVEVNMNPSAREGFRDIYKDAVFISTHKFIGGPGCPGLLVAKKNLFTNTIPSHGGGGTVFFVTENHHRYLKEIEVREEGGTPDIVGSIRAGLVFQLKDNVTVRKIYERDEEILRTVTENWTSIDNLILLGNHLKNKLPIFSFVIQHPNSKKLLHHNYVAVLLNDLFGIQSRGGCACAGPYAQKLLGMTEDIALEIEDLLLEDQRLDRHHLRRYREYSDKEILRPGFTRLNFPFFFNDDEIMFVIKAIALIARHGWKLLPQYLFNPETGEWKHKDHKILKDRKWLGSIKYGPDGMTVSGSKTATYNISFEEMLKEAEMIFTTTEKQFHKCGDQTLLFGDKGERLRWFLLPCEAQDYLKGTTPKNCKNFQMPFYPGKSIAYNQKDLNDNDGSENTLYNHHFCTCSPYKRSVTREIVHGIQETRINPTDSDYKNKTKNDREKIKNDNIDEEILSVNHRKFKSASEDKLRTRGLNNASNDNIASNSPNTQANNETQPVNDSCSLLCKPVASRKYKEVSDNPYTAVKFHNPPKSIFSLVAEGIEEFQMIKDGDRVLLCLSGGKDSLSMLHVIKQYQYRAKSKGILFEFGAMTVDPQSAGYDPSPLIGYLKALDVPYFYEEQDIIAAAANLPICTSICSFCSRMKRGRIYACARREKYNVIALGQHLDDLAESFLMSTFHNGYLRSMKANYFITEGDLRVIRPLVYVREKDLREFAEKVSLPVIPENCPACFEAPKERHRMKQLLAQQECLFPDLFKSLKTALYPLIAKDKVGLEQRNLESDDEENTL